MQYNINKTIKFKKLILLLIMIVVAVSTYLIFASSTFKEFLNIFNGASGMEKILISTAMISLIGVLVVSVFFMFKTSEEKEEVEKIAFYDEVTGLPNLEHFKNYVAKTLKENPEGQFVAVKMDINNFKSINEIFGFEIGDKVLKAFSKTAAMVDEKSYMLARSSADEFLMFSGNGLLETLQDITPFYEDLFKQYVPEISKYNITFNYGRYYIDKGEEDISTILTKVSMAHTQSKLNKDGAIWDYDDTYKQRIKDYASLTSKMEPALLKREFQTYLQPKFNLKENKIAGAEALFRWIEADGNKIYPDKFINLFEHNGFMIDLDKYMIDKVCKTIREWRDNGWELVPISINLSRVHFEDKEFINELVKIINKYEIDRKYIELEIPETILLNNERIVKKMFAELKEEGFTVTVDNFGAQYASISTIKDFGANNIKFDKSFIIKSEENEKANKVLEGVIEIAKSVGTNIIAEGVENESQLKFLEDIKCEYAQGYLLAMPMSIKEFNETYFKN